VHIFGEQSRIYAATKSGYYFHMTKTVFEEPCKEATDFLYKALKNQKLSMKERVRIAVSLLPGERGRRERPTKKGARAEAALEAGASPRPKLRSA
jgi:hypothetical protein